MTKDTETKPVTEVVAETPVTTEVKPAKAKPESPPAKAKAASTPAKAEKAKPVSNDPQVPAGPAVQPTDAPDKAETSELTGTVATPPESSTPAPTTDVAAASDAGNGTVDPQAAAKAGRAKREAASAAAAANAGNGVLPSGSVVRQLEDGVETDRRAGTLADKSLAGENLPVLRPNEPDPRQGVTSGESANPGVQLGELTQDVTFVMNYAVYNRGETARFGKVEAARLIALRVAE